MRQLALAIVLFLSFFNTKSFAQTHTEQVSFLIPPSATVSPSEIKEDWVPALQNVEAPKPDGKKSQLQKIKDSLARLYPRKYIKSTIDELNLPKRKVQLKTTALIPAPFIGNSFNGNQYTNSTPNDNDIAISNGDQLISVQNTTIFTCDVHRYPTTHRWISLSAFAYKLGNLNSKFDPKVIYDPLNDKYVLVFLNGFTDSTSSITVGFSHTNDPNGAWSLYSLPGNPFNNGLWTDYPMLAMTEKELFITANLLYPDSSWQTGFNETIIWQINKNKGYNGLSLNALVHHNILFGGRPVRNLCPVKGGSKLYGPEMYFLSDRNLAPQNDTVFLVRLNDTIGSPGFSINVQALKAPISYFAPPDALQPPFSGGVPQTLATNDARMLGAFYENDKIQYVHNTLDTATGNAAVYHGVINNISSSPFITSHIIADSFLEFGYPNISYTGKSSTEDNSIINFDHASAKIFPGISALASDGAGNYSSLLTLKSGTDYLRVLGGKERWGDYSGSQRKYNQAGRVWVNGLYANPSKQNVTWITELSVNSLASIAPSNNSETEVTIYPNPTTEYLQIQIVLDKPENVQFLVYDINGMLVKELLRERVKAGKNNFSFATNPLPAGNYFIRVVSESREIYNQKFQKL